MKHEFWTIAYRRRQNNKTLLDNIDSPFQVIPNNWRYWYADPHLFYDGHNTFVFAEAYDRILRRGVISYCEIKENGVTPWKVALKQPYHLSYPHLISVENEIYMIPESYVANEIAVFRAKQFPNQWEKVAVLKQGGEPVDSTVFSFGNKSWLMSMMIADNKNCLMLYPLSNDGNMGDGQCVKESDPNVRPAGHLFWQEYKLIRPAQDCTKSYGCALNLYEVTAVSENNYAEKLLCKISPNDLQSNLKYKADGIHTYNNYRRIRSYRFQRL